MGDLPKPSDDVTWTDVELSFFAEAPPEEPELAPPPTPRRELMARLRPVVAGAWQRVRAGAAGLVAAFSLWRVDQRRVALAFVGAIVVTGLSAGAGAFGPVAPPNGGASIADPAPRPEPPASGEAPAARAQAPARRAHAHRASQARPGAARPSRALFTR